MAEIRNGFKETEIGEIPAEWDVVHLQDVAVLTMGQSPPSSTYNTDGIGLPFLQGKAEFGEIYPSPVKWCSEPARVVQPGTVLISVRAPVGDVNISPVDLCIGRGLAGILGRDGLTNPYLFFCLRYAKSRIESEGTGSTFKSVNKNVLAGFAIPLPPLPEQRRIAAALSAIQRAIAAQDDLIAAARELKRSLMHRLFTYGPGREPAETKETEIGEIPVHWEVVKLGQISTIERGKFAHRPRNDPDFYGGPIPFIQTGDVTQSDGKITTYSQTLNEKGLSISRVFPKGTIVLTIAANIGDTAILEFDSAFPDSLVGITPTEDTDSWYLNYYLQTQKQKMDDLAPKGTQKNINLRFLNPWPAPKPPIDEQEKIVQYLSSVDVKIAAEENRKSALQELFRSALHQLMTGRIRLCSDEGLPLP